MQNKFNSVQDSKLHRMAVPSFVPYTLNAGMLTKDITNI